jgi:hypothetical protein
MGGLGRRDVSRVGELGAMLKPSQISFLDFLGLLAGENAAFRLVGCQAGQDNEKVLS